MKDNIGRKGLVVGIILLFVGAGVIPSTIGFIEEKTAFTSSISPGYIQDLIDNASHGDTIYIPSGTYYENIIINKSISLIGEDKNTTIIDANNWSNVVEITADWVSIQGFRIENGGEHGIKILSRFSTVSDNIISMNNLSGIYTSSSYYNNNFTGNTIRMNNWCGIYIRSSDHNIISGNNILQNCDDGIDFEFSNENIIVGNTITNNDEGIIMNPSCDNNIISDNIISLNNGWGIYIGNSNRNTITGNKILSNIEGIGLYDETQNNIITSNLFSKNIHAAIYMMSTTSQNIITDNNLINNNAGILLSGSNSTVSGNTIISNINAGIRLSGSNNTVICNSFFDDGLDVNLYTTENTVSGNTVNSKPLVYLEDESDIILDFDVGQVILLNCDNILIENLNITNTDSGIQLCGTYNSIIRNNNLSNNDNGIDLDDSSGITITSNNILKNKKGLIFLRSELNMISGNIIIKNVHGIYLWHSSNNTIRNNNFLYNLLNAFFRGHCENVWKHNYWNRPRIIPKMIFGLEHFYRPTKLLFDFDWCPALRPYDIGV